jgi:membrane protein
MAAGMSFFGLMSLVPLLLIAVSTLGYVLGSSERAQDFIAQILKDNFPSSAKDMLEIIYSIITSPERNLVNGLSLLGLTWSGLRFFNILQSVLNSIWVGATPRKFLIERAIGFTIFMAAGAFFWFSFAIHWVITAIREIDYLSMIVFDISGFWLAVELIMPLIALIIMTFFVYMFVPNVRVEWKGALIGSVFASLFIETFKWIFSFIVLRFNSYGKVYGPLAGIIIFISWLYMSMQIFLLGAELASQCQLLFFSSTNKSDT